MKYFVVGLISQMSGKYPFSADSDRLVYIHVYSRMRVYKGVYEYVYNCVYTVQPRARWKEYEPMIMISAKITPGLWTR